MSTKPARLTAKDRKVIEKHTAELCGTLKERRQALHITQEQMAEALDMSALHYRRIENGQKMPSFQKFMEISRVLGMKVSLT